MSDEKPADLTGDDVERLAKLGQMPEDMLVAALDMQRAALAPSLLADAIARETLERIKVRRMNVRRLRYPDEAEPFEVNPLLSDPGKDGALLRKELRDEERALRDDEKHFIKTLADGTAMDKLEKAAMHDGDGASDPITARLKMQAEEREKMKREARKSMERDGS